MKTAYCNTVDLLFAVSFFLFALVFYQGMSLVWMDKAYTQEKKEALNLCIECISYCIMHTFPIPTTQ